MDEIDEIIKERSEEYGDPELFFPILDQIWDSLDEYRAKAHSPHKVEGSRSLLYMMAYKLLKAAYNPLHLDSGKDLVGYSKIFQKIMKEKYLLKDLDAKDWDKE